MLEEQKAWKREAGFVYIETAAETDARRSRSNVVSGTLFYRNMFNLSRPYILDEFTLEMRVDVECLRMEITLTQPAPQPRYDPTPRRLRAADTGSEEPGTLRRSLAIGTGSEEPGVSRAQTSTDTEEMFPLESSTYVFFAFKLHKPRAGVYFASARRRGRRWETNYRYFTISRCSRGVRENNDEAAATKDNSINCQSKKQFDRGRSTVKSLFFWREDELSYRLLFACCFSLVFVCFLLLYFSYHVRNLPKQVRKAMSDEDVPDAWTDVPEQERASSSRLALTEGTVWTTLFFGCFTRSVVLFCIVFWIERSPFLVTTDT